MKKNYLKIDNKKDGITLVETIIYMAVFSIFIGGLFLFTDNIIRARISNQNYIEVNSQGSQIINIITQAIRNGSFVQVSNHDFLIVDEAIFSVNENTLFLTEGTNNAVALHNERVFISDLFFSDLSQNDSGDIIKIRFTLNSVYNDYSNNFYGTAGLRRYE